MAGCSSILIFGRCYLLEAVLHSGGTNVIIRVNNRSRQQLVCAGREFSSAAWINKLTKSCRKIPACDFYWFPSPAVQRPTCVCVCVCVCVCGHKPGKCPSALQLWGPKQQQLKWTTPRPSGLSGRPPERIQMSRPWLSNQSGREIKKKTS